MFAVTNESKSMNPTLHSADTRRAATEPQQFPPLELESRPSVPTDQAAHYLLRRPQTLRQWACLENGPLRPVRINGRLAWDVASIRRLLLGVAA
jgi:hypothetical protein